MNKGTLLGVGNCIKGTSNPKTKGNKAAWAAHSTCAGLTLQGPSAPAAVATGQDFTSVYGLQFRALEL